MATLVQRLNGRPIVLVDDVYTTGATVKAVTRALKRGGVSFADQSSWRSVARLAGAPNGAGSFATEVPIDEVVGRVDAGLQILNGGDVGMRVQYEGEFSDNVTSHGGSLRIDFRF